MAERLEIVIEAKDRFSKQFGKLKSMLPSLRTVALGASAAAAGLGAAIFASTKQVANAHDKLQKFGSQLKLSTEFLSGMQHVAELSGVSNLNKGLQMLQVRIGEAARGIGQGKDAFELLGVEIRKSSGALKTAEDLLPELADSFHNLGDATLAAEAASKIFGQRNIEMLQAFTDGRAGLERMTAEAERFGLIVSQQAANNAAEFNDSLYRMRAALKGLQNMLAEEAFPLFSSFFNATANMIADNRQEIAAWSASSLRSIAAFVEYIGYGFALIADTAKIFKMVWDGVFIVFSTFVKAFIDVFNFWVRFIRTGLESFNFRGVFDETIEGMRAFEQKVGETAETIGYFRKAAGEGLAESIEAGFNTAKVAAFADSIKEAIREIKREGMASSEMPGAFSPQIKIPRPDLTEYNEALAENRNKEMEETISHLEQLRTVWQQHTKTQLEQLDIWYEAQLEKVGEFEEARAMLVDIYRERRKEIESQEAEDKVSTDEQKKAATEKLLGDTYQLSMAFGKKAFKLQQALSISQATMSAYEAFNKALANPPGPPFSYAQAAAALALGLARVATIAAQKPPEGGAAGGGLTSVPAEQTYLLHKGERVLSPRQNQDLSDFMQAGQGATASITIEKIEVLPNATSARALLDMDDRELEEAVEEKIIPAFRRLASSGITV